MREGEMRRRVELRMLLESPWREPLATPGGPLLDSSSVPASGRPPLEVRATRVDAARNMTSGAGETRLPGRSSEMARRSLVPARLLVVLAWSMSVSRTERRSSQAAAPPTAAPSPPLKAARSAASRRSSSSRACASTTDSRYRPRLRGDFGAFLRAATVPDLPRNGVAEEDEDEEDEDEDEEEEEEDNVGTTDEDVVVWGG
mmetsp:Transcript_15674/g.49074  ORF Transcript_15674/g.49074 Transcript_15674/m.49074 type:complete len:201 (+) Transcript_15674:905-1507(+)